MNTTQPKANIGIALTLGALLSVVSVGHAFAQELQPIGTLTIPAVSADPVTIFAAGVSYTVPEPTGGGGGGGGGKPSFSTFNLAKRVDGTSPRLLVSAASRRHFPEARIEIFNPAGTAVHTRYDLTSVLVLGAKVQSTEEDNNPILFEEVSLFYGQIKQTVFTPSGPVEGCWSQVTNAPC